MEHIYQVKIILDNGELWVEEFHSFEDAKTYAKQQIWASDTCLGLSITCYERECSEN